MRRKKAITLNLPPLVSAISTAYAEANQRSLSALIEDLLRRKLESEGIPVGLPIEQLIAEMAARFGFSVERAEKKAKAKKKA